MYTYICVCQCMRLCFQRSYYVTRDVRATCHVIASTSYACIHKYCTNVP